MSELVQVFGGWILPALLILFAVPARARRTARVPVTVRPARARHPGRKP